ncbi:MAG: PEP-utilizing enzyme, partial [Spirochaetaceae bacterium]|nr:PEP-utilizing enzyme [Spirochaetaceae bacterium]
MSSIIPFSRSVFTQDENDLSRIGVRGQRLMELAVLDIPILPGFVITNDILADKETSHEELAKNFQSNFKPLEEEASKKFNHKEEPLLVKLVVSPTLNMVSTASSIHNIGLCDSTIQGFCEKVGEDFAYHEYRGVLLKVLRLDLEIMQEESHKAKASHLLELGLKSSTIVEIKKFINETKEFYPGELFQSAMDQFLFVFKKYREICIQSEILSDSAIVVQAMAFGNYGQEGYFGSYYTRNIIDGNDALSGKYVTDSFDSTEKSGKDIGKIDKKVFTILKEIGLKLERKYKEIRQIKFTIEGGKLWIIDQNGVSSKSAMAEIKTLLALLKGKFIDEAFAIKAIKPSRLAEILHPVINRESAEKVKSYTGGISGAVGAAVGKVCFSTEKLVKDSRIAHQRGLKETFILAMPSTYAEDVKAIEAGVGVLTRDGGYASHAPVVARSL